MDFNMFHTAIRILGFIWKKIIYPPLMFTGLIWPFILWFLTGFITLGETNVTNLSVFPLPMWIVAWFLMAYTFIQNVARKITHDPSFKIWKWALGKGMSKAEQKALNPALSDFYQSDLVNKGGYPVGKQKGKWVLLPDSMFYHALVTGGSGTGKSQSQVIPLILKTSLPSLIVDVKRELYEKANKGNSKAFDPADPSAYGYNPFAMVKKESIILDISTIANSLIPVPEEKRGDDFWEREAQNYLAGCLLYLYKHGYNFTAAIRQIQSMNAAKFISEAVAEGDEDVNVFLGHFDGMAENTLSGITATVSSKIMVFASDPDLMRCFSMPDDKCISPQDLIDGKDVFLCIPEARLEVYKHATQLIIGQICKFFERLPDASEKEPRVNFILDEFFRLGYLSPIANGLSTLRSKGVRCYLICQSNAQIELLYGKASTKTICDLCQVKVLLSASDPETQDFYSKIIGTYDKTKKSFSDNKGDFKALGTSGVSVSQEEKRIVKPESLATLGQEAILITPKGWGRVTKKYAWCTPELRQ